MATAEPRRLRLGLVGCSWFAQRAHVPALLRLEAAGMCSLVALCSRTKKSMARVETLIGRSLSRHANLRAMLADEAVEAVLLVLPIPMVAEAIELALRAGKHVISEKPFAPSLRAGLRLLRLHAAGELVQTDVAGTAGRVPADPMLPVVPAYGSWSVCENWAHKRAVCWLRERLDEGVIGQVLAAECSVLDGEMPRPSGGGGSASDASGRQGSGHGHAPGGSAARENRGISGKWRSEAGYEGGIFADVGVHWLRALRRLFGEASLASATSCRLTPITDVGADASIMHAGLACTSSVHGSQGSPEPEPIFEGPQAHDTLHGWIRFERCASVVNLQMSFGMRQLVARRRGLGGSKTGSCGLAGIPHRQPPSVTIHGERGRLMWWALDPGGLCSLPTVAMGGGNRGEHVGGRVALEVFGGGWSEEAIDDDWHTGGVEASLADCLATAAGVAGLTPPASASPSAASAFPQLCTADEAARDMALLQALLTSSKLKRPVAPQECLVAAGELAREEVESLEAVMDPAAGSLTGSLATAETFSAVTKKTSANSAYPWSPEACLLGVPTALGDASGTRQPVAPAAATRCLCEMEIGNALSFAHHRGLSVRPIGTRHSWSVAATPTKRCLRLDLRGMDAILSIHRRDVAESSRRSYVSDSTGDGSWRVVVEPGVTLYSLRRALASNGLTLASWPALLGQTIGGAVGTGSHGSSGWNGTLSDELVGGRIMLASGAVMPFGEADRGFRADLTAALVENDQACGGGQDERCSGLRLLRGARLSAGRLGILTALWLRCEPAYQVRRHVFLLSADEFGERAGALLFSYRHVWAKWRLGADRLVCCALEDVGPAPQSRARWYDGANWWDEGTPFEPPFTREPEEDGAKVPMAAGGRARRSSPEARWWSMEYALPLKKLGVVMRALRSASLMGAASASSTDLSGRVVEIKFIACAGASGPFLCPSPAVCPSMTTSRDAVDASAAIAGNSNEVIPSHPPIMVEDEEARAAQATGHSEVASKLTSSTDTQVAALLTESPREQGIKKSETPSKNEFQALACMNIHWRLEADETVALSSIESVMHALGAAPHLGKAHSAKSPYLRGTLNGYDEFLRLANELDPDGIFGYGASAIEGDCNFSS